MDVSSIKKHISTAMGKYKYVLVVLVIGIVIMMLPDIQQQNTEPVSAEVKTEQKDLSQELSEILSNIKGAGCVQVMLSVEQGEQTIYQTDSTYSDNGESTNSKTQTILVTDADRTETGLIHQKNPPVYLGAVVLAQGADDPTVKLALVDAVSKATGLGADRISVLKMK